MPSNQHAASRFACASPFRQSCARRFSALHGSKVSHPEQPGLTFHGRRFGVGRVISPAECRVPLVHSCIQYASPEFVNAPNTGGHRASANIAARVLSAKSEIFGCREVGASRALNPTKSGPDARGLARCRIHATCGWSRKKMSTPERPATTGWSRGLDRGARLTAASVFDQTGRDLARCDQAAASPVALSHSAPGKTAGANHRGGCRQSCRPGLFHCGVRELASLASVRPDRLRAAVGALSRGLVVVGLRPGHSRDRDGSGYGAATGLHPALAAQKGRGGFDSRARVTSHNDGDPRAKRVNRHAASFDRTRNTHPFSLSAGVVVTSHSEVMQ